MEGELSIRRMNLQNIKCDKTLIGAACFKAAPIFSLYNAAAICKVRFHNGGRTGNVPIR